jgi:thiamine-phosphate diphosphorylase
MASSLDLTLYLVTDSTPAILGSASLLHVVEEAIKGGVTIVQYRDKNADTAVMITTALKLHRSTRKYRIPLLINDRVDVAVAAGAEGVHLGQDDMHISDARKILGDEAIIGVTCCNMEEAENAFQHGADYLGIGTMFPTSTKQGRSNQLSLCLDPLESYTEESRHEIDNRHCRHPSYSRIHCCSRSGHPCRSHWKYQYLKRATSPPSNLLIDAPPCKTLRHRRGKRHSRLARPSIRRSRTAETHR